MVEGIFVGYFDDSKAYKIWIPRTHTVLKARDVIFDESNHIERVTIHATDDDDLPNLWNDEIGITTVPSHIPAQRNDSTQTPDIEESHDIPAISRDNRAEEPTSIETGQNPQTKEAEMREKGYEPVPEHAPKEFETGPWLDPTDNSYGRGKRHPALMAEVAALAYSLTDLESTEAALVVLAEDEPNTYRDAMRSPDSEKWQ